MYATRGDVSTEETMTVLEHDLWIQNIKNQIFEIDDQLGMLRKTDSLRADLLRHTLLCKKIDLLQSLLDNNHN